MNIHQKAANEAKEVNSSEFSGQRLWTAVLLHALEDWQSGNARRRHEAERFLFESSADFNRVCTAAGLAPGSVLAKLQRMKKVARAATQLPCAA
jgi:hypothetical protein